MATVNITTSQNLTSVTYLAGDKLAISAGATLTINSTPSLTIGSITCDNGSLVISNTSTTTPIVITFTNTSSRLNINSLGVCQTRGDYITLYTGDGTVSQTIADFTSLWSGIIDYPSFIEVETASGSGVYRPWYVIPNSGFTINYAAAAFGTNERGNVLFYNASTKVLTCGDGTNGNVIPNGAKVRMANILITAAANTNTITARAQTASTPGGAFDLEKTMFSNAFYVAFSNSSSLRFDHVGLVGRLQSDSGKTWSASYLICNPDTRQTATEGLTGNFIVISPPTVQTFDHVYTMNGTTTAFTLLAPLNVSIDTIEAFVIARTAAIAAVRFTQVASSSVLKNLYAFGGFISLNNMTAFQIQTVRYSDTVTGVKTASNAQNLFVITACSQAVIWDIALSTGGSAFASNLVLDASTNSRIVIHTFTIDGQSNATQLFAGLGSSITLANGTLNNTTSAIFIGGNTGNNIILRNISNNGATASSVLANGGMFDGVALSTYNQFVSELSDTNPFNVAFDAARTTGKLIVAPFAREVAADLYDLTGTAQVGGGGTMVIQNNGDVVVIKSLYPLRSITSFQNTTPTITGTTTGLTFEFRVANWTVNGIRSWSSWLTLNGSNLSTALSGLSGYSNTVGFDMQIRITAGSTVAGRVISKISMPTNNNSSWAPSPDSSIVTLTNAINGTVYGLFDNTTPASPVLVDVVTVGASGSAVNQIEYAFDNSSQSVLLRARKLGYFSKDIATTHTSLDISVPAAQAASVVDVSAGASVTGVSVDHTTQTVTVTTSHTIAEVYAYVQYDLATIANIDKPDFLETTDGTNYTMSYNLTVNNCDLTGTANVSMPSNAFTLSGTATTTLVVTDSSGTNGFLVLTGLSSHAVYVKDNSGTQKLYSASVTGSTTVYIPTGSAGSWTYVIKKAGYKHQVGTIAASTGGTFTITASTPQKLNSDGTDMYLGTTSSLVQVTFSGTTTAYIDIGDGLAPLQAAFDETEDALVTNNGLVWLGAGKDDTSQFNSGGGDFLFLSSGWRLRRWHTTDDNATIQAFVQSVDGTPVDGSNGPVAFLSTDTPETIAAAVHQYAIDGTLTHEESVRLQNAVLFGEDNGADTGSLRFKAANNSARTRITGTGDEFGNRTNIVIVDKDA